MPQQIDSPSVCRRAQGHLRLFSDDMVKFCSGSTVHTEKADTVDALRLIPIFASTSSCSVQVSSWWWAGQSVNRKQKTEQNQRVKCRRGWLQMTSNAWIWFMRFAAAGTATSYAIQVGVNHINSAHAEKKRFRDISFLCKGSFKVFVYLKDRDPRLSNFLKAKDQFPSVDVIFNGFLRDGAPESPRRKLSPRCLLGLAQSICS